MTVKYKYISVLAGCLIFNMMSIIGQIHDNQLWSGATLKISISRKLRFDIEEQVRYNKNISKLNVALTEGSIVYDLTKKTSFKSTFRYFFDPNSHNYYRISGDFSYDLPIKNFPLDFKYRLRFQRFTEEHTHESESYFRNKLSADYNLSKLVDPFVEYESYFKLSHINRFSASRYIVGLDWRLSDNIDLETFFMYEDEFGEKKPKVNKVFGIGLSYNLKL
ncbi:MAG: DUF2490 domain-containing protein [Bacteroidales bacterium]|nr:DUF2490 domain-containing protein [Bacteroidales bacterium]